MAPLLFKTFKIEFHEGEENTPHAARRHIVNSDFLKVSKLFTGDIVAIPSKDADFASDPNKEDQHV